MYLRNAGDIRLVETITESGITGMGKNSIKNKLKKKLANSIQYYLEIEPVAIVDFSNKAFEGLKGNDKWTFSTIVTGIDNVKGKQSVQVNPVPAK